MKGGTRSRDTSHPFTAPSAIPAARAIATTSQVCTKTTPPSDGSTRPRLTRPPAIMPQRPTTDPTDKSMPPLRMTNVMPMARMALIATCLIKMARLPVDRNSGDRSENTIDSTDERDDGAEPQDERDQRGACRTSGHQQLRSPVSGAADAADASAPAVASEPLRSAAMRPPAITSTLVATA